MSRRNPSRPRTGRPGRGRLARDAARTRRRWTAAGVVVAVLAVVAVVGAVALTGGGTATKGHDAVTRLDPRGAFELVRTHAGDPSWVTLDVRTPAEFAAGHLQDATNLDVDDAAFPDRLRALDKDRSYVVYCHTGNRSGRATALMHELGFTQVYDVEGGIAAWQQEGLPITR